VVTAKLVVESTDSKRVQVEAGVQRTHCKVQAQKRMACWHQTGRSMQPTAVQRLGHEQKEATEAEHPCNGVPGTALPPVAVVVPASWVQARKPPAHPLEKHKKHMESTKLP